MNRSLTVLALGLALGLALLTSACDSARIHAPPADAPMAASAPASTGIIARYVGGAPAITIGYAKKTIGPAGGSLRLLDFEIVVPPNAVSKSTEFMIRLPVDPHERELVMAEFGPHGASFAVPVTLRFPLAGTTLEGDGAAAVVWWDGEVWRRLESRTTADGRIEADTDHFSTYGTSDEGESYFGELSSGG